MKDRPDWDAYFMAMLPIIGSRSHDPHTETACLIVDEDRRIRSTGYNGLPSGVREDIATRFERPEKYYWIEHAERNAIYSAARMGVALKGCTLYLNWYPCMDCARAIVQAGIRRIVCDKARTEERWHDPKWTADFTRVATLFSESTVVVDLWAPK
jgi:dCMP deaminase